MILLSLGIIIGILVSILIVSIEIWLKKSILNRIEKKVQSIRKEKGYIIRTLDEEDRAISEIIEENKRKGLDTKLSDLQ